MRTLFVSGEVAPFTQTSELSQLVRCLPEYLQERGDAEIRIMMPRYGTVSERRNRLHEVIRLSGTVIEMDERAETLKVKVASIPGIRLQVYFMDNNYYFKRKGIFADKQGVIFADNLERALFFARGVFATMHNLGWAPEVIHAFGWMSGFVPVLLSNEYSTDPLFSDVKVIFTPDEADFETSVSEEQAELLGLPSSVVGLSPTEAGLAYADLVLNPPSMPPVGDALQIISDTEQVSQQIVSLYEQVLNGVPV